MSPSPRDGVPPSGVPRETLDGLREFEAFFRKRAARVNLVAASQLDVLWERHVLDSAQLPALLPEAARWLDLGSGGGFPGLVIAFLVKPLEGAHVDLVESVGKKAAFLQEAVDRFALPARVWSDRAEDLAPRIPTPDAVSARALAPLPKLLALAAPWLERGAVGLFPKGRGRAPEIEESRVHFSFTMVEHRSVTDSEAAVLEIRDFAPARPKPGSGRRRG